MTSYFLAWAPPAWRSHGVQPLNCTPGDAIMGDINCLCERDVGDCEVSSYAVQPPASCPADCAQGEVKQFVYFIFRWHTKQMAEPTQLMLRQSD